MNKLLRKLNTLAVSFICVLLCAMFFLALLWHAPVLAAIFLLWALVFVPWKLHSGKIWILRGLAIVCLLGLTFLTYHIPFQEVDSRMSELQAVLDQSGPSGLQLTDRVAVYGANISMGLGALILGYPEAALETWLLCIPGPTVRTFASDFPMNSAKVRGCLQGFTQRIEKLPAHQNAATMPETYLAWSDYVSDSPRVSLALNAFRLSARGVRHGEKWRISCSGWVPVSYPRRSWTPLLRIRGEVFHIEEGLYLSFRKIISSKSQPMA